MVLRLRVHLVPARNRANFNPALFRCVTRDKFIERCLHHELLFSERACKLLDGCRLIRRINNRFQCRFPFFVGHKLSIGIPDRSASTRPFHRKPYRTPSPSSEKSRQTVFPESFQPLAASPFPALRETRQSSRAAKGKLRKTESNLHSNLRSPKSACAAAQSSAQP